MLIASLVGLAALAALAVVWRRRRLPISVSDVSEQWFTDRIRNRQLDD